jgi:hypothetical protein
MLAATDAGWAALFREAPSVPRTLLMRVLPFALLPPAMCMYSVHRYPGAVLPVIAPAYQSLAMLVLGAAAVVLEIGVVLLMAGQLRLLADPPERAFDAGMGLREALCFAAAVPVPLWLSSLALLAPSRGLLLLAITLGWIASIALIRRGIPSLFRPRSERHARALARAVVARGLFSWLMVVGALVLPLYAMAALG